MPGRLMKKLTAFHHMIKAAECNHSADFRDKGGREQRIARAGRCADHADVITVLLQPCGGSPGIVHRDIPHVLREVVPKIEAQEQHREPGVHKVLPHHQGHLFLAAGPADIEDRLARRARTGIQLSDKAVLFQAEAANTHLIHGTHHHTFSTQQFYSAQTVSSKIAPAQFPLPPMRVGISTSIKRVVLNAQAHLGSHLISRFRKRMGQISSDHADAEDQNLSQIFEDSGGQAIVQFAI